ncbi:MAG TPA: hypothetical protein VLJ76_01705 [Gaiellaceae bacterium]|nr:hypothetical protein [Gaiellaceae bacterium]
MRIAAVLVLAFASLASLAVAAPGPIVEHGRFLASDQNRHLLVVDGRGHVVRRLPFTRTGCCPGQVELSADRDHAFVSESSDTRFALLKVDLATGRSSRIASGGSPALSPDGRKLAYFSVSPPYDLSERRAVVVRDLTTGNQRVIPFAAQAPSVPAPGMLINWSPDGRKLALSGWNRRVGSVLYVVDVTHARTIESQPSFGHLEAPVFLDNSTLLALANCCTSTHQEMVAISLADRSETPFATLPEPPESLRRISPGTFLATTPTASCFGSRKGA